MCTNPPTLPGEEEAVEDWILLFLYVFFFMSMFFFRVCLIVLFLFTLFYTLRCLCLLNIPDQATTSLAMGVRKLWEVRGTEFITARTRD